MAGACRLLGIAWSVMTLLEIVFILLTKVVTPPCVLAILLRAALAAGAFFLPRLRPPRIFVIAWALVAPIFVLVGLAMSVSPRSSLGFLAFSREDTFSRMPNLFLPEVRQAMNVGNSTLEGVALVVPMVVVLLCALALIQVAAAQKSR